MKYNFGRIAAALLLSSLATSGQAASPKMESAKTVEYKATVKSRSKNQATVRTVGGLDLVSERPGNFGMSPKEYGQLYGTRSKGGKSNRLRMSHNAKVQRRRSK